MSSFNTRVGDARQVQILNQKTKTKRKTNKTISKLGGEKVIIDELDDNNLHIVYDWIIEEEDDISQIK